MLITWKFLVTINTKPYTFMKSMSLEELDKQPIQCDIWDVGGCGCFIDF